MALVPLYTNGKRDKARRYEDTETGATVSRRQAEGLTAKQRASREYKRQGIISAQYRRKGILDVYQTRSVQERHFVRYGPYPDLETALLEPRIKYGDKVMIGAYGRFKKQAVSGRGRLDGWLALSGLTEYGAYRPVRAAQPESKARELQDAAKARLNDNFTQTRFRGIYVWVQK